MFYNLHHHCVAADGAQLPPVGLIHNEPRNVTEGIVQRDEIHNQIVRYLQWLFKVKRIARVNVRGDGNCLFRAYSLAMYGDENQHGLLRQQVVRFMLDNRLKFVGTQFHTETDVMNYIEGITPLGSYAGNLEHLILPYIFNVNVLMLTAAPDGISPTNNRKFYPGVYNSAACPSLLRGQITGGYEKNQAFSNVDTHLILFFHGDVNHPALNHYQCYFALDQQNHLICPCAYDNFFVNPQVRNEQGSGNQPIGDDLRVIPMQEQLDWSTDHPDSFFDEHSTDTNASTVSLSVETITQQTGMNSDCPSDSRDDNDNIQSAALCDTALATRSFACTVCDKNFHFIRNYNKHLKTASHMLLERNCETKLDEILPPHLSTSTFISTTVLTCTYCTKVFRYKKCYEKHALQCCRLSSTTDVDLDSQNLHKRAQNDRNLRSKRQKVYSTVVDNCVMDPFPEVSVSIKLAPNTVLTQSGKNLGGRPKTRKTQATDSATATSKKPRGGRQRDNSKKDVFSVSGCGRRDKAHQQVTLWNAGNMNMSCKFCDAQHFAGEKVGDHFSLCCQNGKVKLDGAREIKPYPPTIKTLFGDKNDDGKNFRENIRQYNTALSMASLKANLAPPPGYGPYTFRIHGQMYTRAGSLHPSTGDKPTYSQLYTLDSSEAADTRMLRTENAKCKIEIMKRVDAVLREINCYVKAYRNMHDVELEEEQLALSQNRTVRPVRMTFCKNNAQDRRRYNIPNANEIAAVFVGENGEPPTDIDFTIYPKDQPLQTLSYTSPHADPMVYPLLFPHGEQGWDPHMQHQEERATPSRTRLTLRQYYAYRLAVRKGFSAIHSSGKLFHQYCVGAYVRQEGNALNYLRNNQSQLRTDRYKGLMDHLNSDNASSTLAGVPIILPSSFTGSPRHMQQNYQDSMALVRQYGRPDLFITFTCNPNWPEIKNNLNGADPSERPDIIARVFNLKLKELMDDLCVKNIFGKFVACVQVVEFQKRGLPHAHILLILRDKIHSPEDIDKIVKAEIPEESDTVLYNSVKSHMVHGPCGFINTYAPCMTENVCSKKYPKDFAESTVENENGYPKYRRRENGRHFIIRNTAIDNRWIVPYNEYLLRKFDAHINVEICSSMKSVKYLYKYVHKGHDCINVKITQESGLSNDDKTQPDVHDEITTYLDGRYVSAPEATWRIFSFPLTYISHTIVRLAVHLPDEQNVVFVKGQEQAALERSTSMKTTLTAYFELNKTDCKAQQLSYMEVPLHYIFVKGNYEKRKQAAHNNMISRMFNVSPKDRERYFLRLLLLNVKGATSFENLRTLNKVLYPTFQEAAKAYGLLADDQVWFQCLREAVIYQMPRQLRFLYAIICVFCAPSEPVKLYEEFKDLLQEDFARNFNATHAQNECLLDIEETLRMHGSSCTALGLPQPTVILVHENNLYNVEIEKAKGLQQMNMLNSSQRKIADEVLAALDFDTDTRAFFVDGAGGCGKTFLYKTLLHVLRGMGKSALPVAFSGIAATLLEGGRTVHSRFKLPLQLTETSVSTMRLSSFEAKTIREAHLIIWDEAPMAPSTAFTVVHKLLQEIMVNTAPFGGKLILFGGDFRQVLPVVKGPRSAVVNACIKRNKLWAQIKQPKLETNMRAGSEENEFASWLIRLGDGKLPHLKNIGENAINLPSECIITTPVEDFVFDGNIDGKNIWRFSKRAVLCPTNEDCHIINNKIVAKMEGEMRTYKSIDTIVSDTEEEANNYPIEFLNSLIPSGLPPHELKLKPNVIIMLLRNLSPKRGLCNGTRLIVRQCQPNVIDADVLDGVFAKQRVFLPRIDLMPSESTLPFAMKRRQFPVRIAFAMTINKAQGQTLEQAGLYLSRPVFCHGQLYVAFSRVQRLANIKVQVMPTEAQGCSENTTYTSNVVYQEVL